MIFLAEIFLNYPLIQQHSSGSPLLKYVIVNTLPCEMQQPKIMAEHCGFLCCILVSR